MRTSVCGIREQGHLAPTGCKYPHSSPGSGDSATTSPWRNYPQSFSALGGKNKSCIYPVLVFLLGSPCQHTVIITEERANSGSIDKDTISGPVS